MSYHILWSVKRLAFQSLNAILLLSSVHLGWSGTLTYVPGSLTDSNPTSGNGVSSPAGSSNIQYSDGSGSLYGQIDIANDPADPDWIYDQGSAQAIHSVDLWSYGGTTAHSQMPSGTITIHGSASSTGPWTQIGQITRSMVRDTTLPNSQATAGEGFRVPCNGSSYRYIRINVVTPSSSGGLDNQWVIRKVETNKNIVVHEFYRTSDGSSAINDLPRIPYHMFDGSTSTLWNPGATAMALTLDLGATPRRFQQIIMTPDTSEGGYLPQKGEVLVSSTDDPENMDTVVGLFDISYSNINTDPALIILPQPFKKRFVQLRWDTIRNPSLTESRIAELTVDTVPEKPQGQDLTSLAIDPSYMIVPGDIAYAALNTSHLQAALDHYKYVYLPQGTYYFDGMIFMPDDSRLHGYSDDTTILRFTSTTTVIRAAGTDNVRLDHFRIERTVDHAEESAIYIYKTGTNVPHYTEIDNVKIISNRSRAGTISLHQVEAAGVTNCIILDSQRTKYDFNGGTTSYNYIWGSGIQCNTSRNIYIHNNHIEERRNLLDTTIYPMTGRPPNHDVIQAGGIEPSGSTFVIVTDNYVKRYGVGVDINGASKSLVSGNTTTETNNCGVKLCNGTNNCRVLDNQLDQAGIVGVWLAPGNGAGNVEYNLVDGNTITAAGDGINIGGTAWGGTGFMGGYASSWCPSGIALEDSATLSTRVQYNTVTDNIVSGTAAIKTPVSTYGIFISPGGGGRHAPYMNTLSGNTIVP